MTCQCYVLSVEEKNDQNLKSEIIYLEIASTNFFLLAVRHDENMNITMEDDPRVYFIPSVSFIITTNFCILEVNNDEMFVT